MEQGRIRLSIISIPKEVGTEEEYPLPEIWKKSKARTKKPIDNEKAERDESYEEFEKVIKERLVIEPGRSIRSSELTEEVNKYLTLFKLTNNGKTPIYMNRFMEENKSVKRKRWKGGVKYVGIGKERL